MTFFQRLWTIFRLRTPEQAPREPACSVVEPAAKRGRPASASLLRTIDLVRSRPELTARELAQDLSVTPAYARTLLRRAQAKLSDPAGPPRPLVGAAGPDRDLVDLHARLDRTEKSLAALCSTPPVARGAWNLNRRAEVLRLAASGMATAEIALRLSIPAGEVDFILKVDLLLQRAK